METVSSAVLEFLVSLLVAGLTLLSGYAVAFVRRKLGFISESFAQEMVRSGIALAEETAAGYLRRVGEKIAPEEKLAIAAAFVLKKLPGVSEAEAEDLIMAELPKVGLGAAGFLSAVAAKMRQPDPAPAVPEA